MRYEKPMPLSDQEIEETLSRIETTPSARIEAIVSAIFHFDDPDAAADLLIDEFSKAKYGEKIYLVGLFQTFYQSRETTYRIDKSISLLEAYKLSHLVNVELVDEAISGLIEFRSMFESTMPDP